MLNKQSLQQAPPTDKAQRAAGIFLGASLLIALVYGYLALFQIRQWQMSALTGVFVVYSLVALVSLVLIRREQFSVGVWLLIGGMYFVFPALAVLVTAVGLVLGISLIMLTIMLATRFLPRTQATWAIFSSAVIAVAIVLFDSPARNYRLDAAPVQFFIGAVAVATAVTFAFLIVRQFVNYSLRTKLVVAFLLVSLLSIAVVAFFSIRTTSNALTEEVGGNLKGLANSQAFGVGTQLVRQVNVLNSLTLSRSIHDRLLVVNSNYGDDPQQVEARLQQFERQWVANVAANQGPLLSARLNNLVSAEFLKLQEKFPDNNKIFITDKYGGLLATTAPIPDYSQSDETWWQKTYNNGQGAIYISQPTTDDDSDIFGIIIGLPFYDDDGNVIGVLRSTFNLASLVNLVTAGTDPQAGIDTELLFSSGYKLAGDGQSLEKMDPDVVKMLDAPSQEPFAEMNLENQPQLVSYSKVLAVTGEPIIEALGWKLLVHQNRDKALAPVQAQRRNTIIVAVVLAAAVIGAALLMAGRMANPIVRLTQVAQQIAAGDLKSRATVESGDEVGALAKTFNSMADQLSEIIGTLGDHVSDRTQQLTTVVDVSQRLSSILDLSDLMREVVTLTKETFGYYHAHIYLLDDQHETLIMAEGYGQAGAEMKRRAHSIPLNAARSLVAQAVRESRIITVEDVRQDPHWLPNPLLPNTRSEAAIPVVLGNEVVGALDVQSDRVGGITTDDEVVLQALANQIAIAVRNARLFSETQEALYRAQRLQQIYTGEAWRQFSGARSTDYEVRQPELPPLQEIPTPEANIALEKEQTIRLNLDKVNGSEGLGQAGNPKETNSLATPLKLRGQIIGVLGLRAEDPNRQWTDDEIALIEAIGEQMSVAIENARLFDETGRRAGREKIIADVTQQVWASGDLEKVMQTAVEQLGAKFEASKVVIRLGTEEQLIRNGGAKEITSGKSET